MPNNDRDNEKIVVYSYYNNLAEAYEAKNLLERNGIDSFISNENMATVYPMFDSNVGGIRLNLFEKDIPAAQEILSSESQEEEK